MAWDWYSWETSEAFDDWHGRVLDGLGYPLVGFNEATQEPDPAAQQTIAYTSARRVSASDWRAPVESHVASAFADGLGQLSSPPPPPPSPSS